MKKKMLKYNKEVIKRNLIPGDILEITARENMEIIIITKKIKLV